MVKICTVCKICNSDLLNQNKKESVRSLGSEQTSFAYEILSDMTQAEMLKAMFENCTHMYPHPNIFRHLLTEKYPIKVELFRHVNVDMLLFTYL